MDPILEITAPPNVCNLSEHHQTCQICYTYFENNIFFLSCHHYFCKNCLSKLTVKTETFDFVKCPFCRKKTYTKITQMPGELSPQQKKDLINQFSCSYCLFCNKTYVFIGVVIFSVVVVLALLAFLLWWISLTH